MFNLVTSMFCSTSHENTVLLYNKIKQYVHIGYNKRPTPRYWKQKQTVCCIFTLYILPINQCLLNIQNKFKSKAKHLSLDNMKKMKRSQIKIKKEAICSPSLMQVRETDGKERRHTQDDMGLRVTDDNLLVSERRVSQPRYCKKLDVH